MFWTIVIAVIGIAGGWKRGARRSGARHAPVQAAERYIEREEATEAEREAIRRDAAKQKVRFR